MLIFVLLTSAAVAAEAKPRAQPPSVAQQIESLRLAIVDLNETFGARYPRGQEYFHHLDAIERDDLIGKDVAAELARLRQEALLANPLLDFDRLLVLDRRHGQLGLPANHLCNSALPRTGYDNAIAVLSPVRPKGKLAPLYRPAGGEFVGEIDLDFDARRLLFTMPKGRAWQVFEIAADGGASRQVVPGDHADVDNFDACYLPDGRIVFGSTAQFHAVPCWHGQQRACALYLLDADRKKVRQLCFDQDLDLYASVMPDGQILYSRWDYTGPMHMYLRPLMAMNPDGTGQRAVYGSNSYWPNALYHARGIPGAPGKIVAVVAGYHGVPRMGELAVLDIAKGWHEAEGVVQRIPGRGKPVRPVIRDNLVDHSWPKFLHPWPLSDKYFLVSAQIDAKSPWAIYLADVFDNMVLVHQSTGRDLFEPIPLKPRPKPPAIPDRVDLSRDDAVAYVHDVYAGPGLAGVPRGTIQKLRIVAYHFGYPGMAGPDKVGLGGPWEVMRILGTVPVEQDGSAKFRVPANTPLSIQALDREGKAVQLMRSWYTAMPGEVASCVGCHDRPRDTPRTRRDIAGTLPPAEIEPWRGPPRGFSFAREVQPVLDKYCVACHRPDSPLTKGQNVADLRPLGEVPDYQGRPFVRLEASRLHPATRKAFPGNAIKYTPAYEALIPFVRRVGIEDDVELLVPGEYHADTSELVQMIKRGHHGVKLDAEAWDRLVTWIDLNAPCYGTWNEICKVPEGADRRRGEMFAAWGGPKDDPEVIPPLVAVKTTPIVPAPLEKGSGPIPKVNGWPLGAVEARSRQAALGETEKTIDLGDGVSLRLVRVPAGKFVMGDMAPPSPPAPLRAPAEGWSGESGVSDARPAAAVEIARDFWVGQCEVTNAQFQRFDPRHDSGLFTKRFQGPDGPGLSLRGEDQPALRVSWQRAMVFCRWLSQRSGLKCSLPTEAQWEYACRAGTATAMNYGNVDDDFSESANLADFSLSLPPKITGGLSSNLTHGHGRGIFPSAMRGGDVSWDDRFDDRAVATAAVGRYRPNAWGLFDMHGNAAEWTRSEYRPYPYRDDDGRNTAGDEGVKIVRGGSFCDRPGRATSACRLAYPAWQRVHNVGFRIVAE